VLEIEEEPRNKGLCRWMEKEAARNTIFCLSDQMEINRARPAADKPLAVVSQRET
jgi:hypothetical protein